MIHFIYTLLIAPLEVLIDFIFSQAYRICGSAGTAVIIVSIIVQTLVLPLYNRADSIQAEERKKQKSMEHWLDHIRKTFTGDERMMMINEYYRQQNYKSIYVLRSSLSLLLQIPFFTAAYNYLSAQTFLQGASFGPIPNLGAPDGLLKLFGTDFNLLPILMTGFNLISSVIYLRDFTMKEKLQQYALALVFLVLLYDRPAGLVLYWTMNNVYSLLKNLLKEIGLGPDLIAAAAFNAGALFIIRFGTGISDFVFILYLILCLIFTVRLQLHSKFTTAEISRREAMLAVLVPGIMLAVWVFRGHRSIELLILLSVLCIGYLILLGKRILQEGIRLFPELWGLIPVVTALTLVSFGVKRNRFPHRLGIYLCFTGVLILFSGLILRNKAKILSRFEKFTGKLPLLPGKDLLWPELILTVLMGLVIPLSVISDSPLEFITDSGGPSGLVCYTLLLYAGIFLVWMNVFYRLFGEDARKITFMLLTAAAFTALVNFFFFGKGKGMIDPYFVYVEKQIKTVPQLAINTMIAFGIIAAAAAFGKNLQIVYKPLCAVLIICLLLLTGVDLHTVRTELNANAAAKQKVGDPLVMKFSRNGKNVVILMLDRAFSPYLPFVFEEKPELQASFSGFTYYPNTLSFGGHTNLAAPALWGGYEYTPVEMNRRDTEDLPTKHNEAMQVLPRLFSQNGFHTVLCDLPYINYQEFFDPSLFDSYPNTETYSVYDLFPERNTYNKFYEARQKRNAVYYAAMKSLPLLLQSKVYDEGVYHALSASDLTWGTLREYSLINDLISMTDISDGDENRFLEMVNNLTHEAAVLKVPEYIPDPLVSFVPGAYPNRTLNGITLKMDLPERVGNYDVFMAAIQALAKWLDHLKASGVYDNSRIIIAADHGIAEYTEQIESMLFSDGNDIERYNPLLLVKDFDADDEFRTDQTFMTNADVPTLALKDLIPDPVNPFTGKSLDNDEKYLHDQFVTTSLNWEHEWTRNTKFDTSDGAWYAVHDDLFDEANWTMIDDPMTEVK